MQHANAARKSTINYTLKYKRHLPTQLEVSRSSESSLLHLVVLKRYQLGDFILEVDENDSGNNKKASISELSVSNSLLHISSWEEKLSDLLKKLLEPSIVG